MTTKNTSAREPLPMQVTTLDAVGEVLKNEKAYCEHCGAELPLWPPDEVRLHVFHEHRAAFWPQHLEMYEKFLAEAPTTEHLVALQRNRADYLVRVLSVRFDLYQKLVDAGAIVSPAAG